MLTMGGWGIRLPRTAAEDTGPFGAPVRAPCIIYASRTHSQLAQAIRELRRTSYRPTIGILGARDQLCVHPSVSRLPSSAAKQVACRQHVRARTCRYFTNLDGRRGDGTLLATASTVSDIEELVRIGVAQQVCPYFLERELQSKADVIFTPYNYLLDPQTRMAQGIDLQDAVVIFDEAHNLVRRRARAVSSAISPPRAWCDCQR